MVWALLIIHTASTSLPSPWSCPLPGFRLMTSDSPLRGASCLQSAVRLLVIIFQSVTLVSALWRCERREDGGPADWMAEAESEGGSRQGVMLGGGQRLRSCVYVCVDWSGGGGGGSTGTGCHCTLLSASWLCKNAVSVLKGHNRGEFIFTFSDKADDIPYTNTLISSDDNILFTTKAWCSISVCVIDLNYCWTND